MVLLSRGVERGAKPRARHPCPRAAGFRHTGHGVPPLWCGVPTRAELKQYFHRERITRWRRILGVIPSNQPLGSLPLGWQNCQPSRLPTVTLTVPGQISRSRISGKYFVNYLFKMTYMLAARSFGVVPIWHFACLYPTHMRAASRCRCVARRASKVPSHIHVHTGESQNDGCKRSGF